MEPFAQRGPAAVSVREVAARAGVNHALVFRHFGSKDGLVQAVWERVVQDLAGRVVAAPDQRGLVVLAEALAESETIWKLLARAVLDGQAATIAAYRYPFVDTLVWAAARGQEAGLLTATAHPRLLVAMVVALGFGWLIYHPVLLPLLGIPMRDVRERREELRDAVMTLLGWRGETPAVARGR
jgi:AcrR family transcriptional regulator